MSCLAVDSFVLRGLLIVTVYYAGIINSQKKFRERLILMTISGICTWVLFGNSNFTESIIR